MSQISEMDNEQENLSGLEGTRYFACEPIKPEYVPDWALKNMKILAEFAKITETIKKTAQTDNCPLASRTDATETQLKQELHHEPRP